MDKNKLIKSKIIYETNTFNVEVPAVPHISREEGGHLWIIGKKHISDRYELSPKEATELIRLTMLVGEAMIIGMKKRGIIIERINFQDNGNWAYLKNYEPVFHIHLYGRTRNSVVQKFGEALNFPNPDTDFYNDLIPFDDYDIIEIKNAIKELEKGDKYNLKEWNL